MQNTGMAKHKSNKMIDELFSECASANECTGLYQKVSLDPDEVAKLHAQFTGEEE